MGGPSKQAGRQAGKGGSSAEHTRKQCTTFCVCVCAPLSAHRSPSLARSNQIS